MGYQIGVWGIRKGMGTRCEPPHPVPLLPSGPPLLPPIWSPLLCLAPPPAPPIWPDPASSIWLLLPSGTTSASQSGLPSGWDGDTTLPMFVSDVGFKDGDNPPPHVCFWCWFQSHPVGLSHLTCSPPHKNNIFHPVWKYQVVKVSPGGSFRPCFAPFFTNRTFSCCRWWGP